MTNYLNEKNWALVADKMAEGRGRYFVEFRDCCSILWMNNVENRFNNNTLKELNDALDEVESNRNVKFLVVIGKGKFFSNGLDLNKIAQYSHEDIKKFVNDLNSLLLRLLTFPVPTIAAINGHAYAGGVFMALCHDYRIMRTKKGWFCFPEIHLEMKIPPLLMAIVKTKIVDPRVRTDAVVMGKRYTAEEAFKAKLVDQICDHSVLLETAIQIGRSVVGTNNWSRQIMSDIKQTLYSDVIEVKKQVNQWHKTALENYASKL